MHVPDCQLMEAIFWLNLVNRNALEEEGIEKIPAKGESFDPNLHQAVQTVPATEDTPADTIVEVLFIAFL